MGRRKTFIVWTLTSMVAFWLLLAGLTKLWGGLGWAQRFSEWGYPAWMIFLTGLAEVGGSLLLVFPRSSVIGAGVLAVVMLGAMLTELIFTGLAGALPAAVLLAMLGVILGLRWNQVIGREMHERDDPELEATP